MTIHDVMKLDILRPTVGCGECTAQRVGRGIIMNHCSSQSDRNSVQDLFTFHYFIQWILVMFSTLDVFCLYIIVQNVSTV